jgi:hypothetical protein
MCLDVFVLRYYDREELVCGRRLHKDDEQLSGGTVCLSHDVIEVCVIFSRHTAHLTLFTVHTSHLTPHTAHLTLCTVHHVHVEQAFERVRFVSTLAC